ncbi:MAG: hypothetical protein JXB30_19650 [Anaerolineae bacterium]|nr:hypothetical protein [Anaerolineae bacterium]
MSEKVSLKELEGKAWRSVFQDGMWDIFLGLLLVAMAVNAWMSDSGLAENIRTGVYIGLEIVAMGVLWAGKRFITVPRMGRVKFGKGRRSRKLWVTLVVGLSALLGVVVFQITQTMGNSVSFQSAMRTFFPAFWAAGCIVFFSLGAYLLDFSRLYLIGILYALPVPTDHLLHRLFGLDLSSLAFGLPGLTAVVMGLVVMIRFMREYPIPHVPEEEVVDGIGA